VAEISCITDSKGGTYIVLGKTNYGNCKACEWVDVFTDTGLYVGSSDGMYATDFKRQRLSNVTENSICNASGQDDSNSSSKISITRSRWEFKITKRKYLII